MKKILLLICCFAIAGLGYANKVAYQLSVNPENKKELIVSAVPDFVDGTSNFSGGNVVIFTNSFLRIQSITSTVGNWSTSINGIRFMGQKVYQFNAPLINNGQTLDGITELFRLTFNSARAANFVQLLNQRDAVGTDASASSIDFKVMMTGIHHTAALQTGSTVDGAAFNGVLASNETPNTPVAMATTSKTSVFPNPSSGEQINVTIETEATENVLVQVQTLDGKVVYNNQTDLAEGYNTFELDLNELVSGVYMLTVNGERTNHIQQIAIVK